MPVWTEMLGNRAIGREKTLGMSWGLEAFHEQAWRARRDTCEDSAEGELWHAFCSATKLRGDMPRHTYGLLEEETCPWSALMT
jgi:hypothetical protein